jgi:hypothetical protein
MARTSAPASTITVEAEQATPVQTQASQVSETAILADALRKQAEANLLQAKLEEERRSENPRKVSMAEHARRTRYTPFPCTVYQNGFRWSDRSARGMDDATKEKLGQLRSGRFLNGFVTVRREGEILCIDYPWLGTDNQIRISQYFKSESDLIRKLWVEQNAGSAQ